MNEVLRARFSSLRNEDDLRSAIESICAEFGKVTRLKILAATKGESPQCLCFLRLDSLDAEAELQKRYHVSKFADDFLFIVDLDEN